MHLADSITADSNAIATLVVAITGLVAAVGTLLAVLLTNRKVGNVGGQVKEVNDTVNAVQQDTQIIRNGGPPHDASV